MRQDLEAGAVGQCQVKDDEVDRPLAQRAHGFGDAARLLDFDSLPLEAVAYESTDRHVIFHHQDAHQPAAFAIGRASEPSADRTASRRAPSLKGLWMIASPRSSPRLLPKTSLL